MNNFSRSVVVLVLLIVVVVFVVAVGVDSRALVTLLLSIRPSGRT
jgi:hypothetical protein